MQEVAIAGLVGAGVGYLVRFGQEQIPRAVRGLARNELVAGTARRGRDVVQAGVKGGMQVAQAGARGGLEVARAAAGRASDTARPGATGRSRPAQAVRVPVGKGGPTTRRTAGRASGQGSARKREAARRNQSIAQSKAAVRSTRRTTP